MSLIDVSIRICPQFLPLNQILAPSFLGRGAEGERDAGRGMNRFLSVSTSLLVSVISLYLSSSMESSLSPVQFFPFPAARAAGWFEPEFR
mmetsp:Transcript_52036/g.101909  ORF Transcript_52036/g.101909 Transcript_52036/m.101909 type:complete len:90 (-) Transcript_52036:631-900(-)